MANSDKIFLLSLVNIMGNYVIFAPANARFVACF